MANTDAPARPPPTNTWAARAKPSARRAASPASPAHTARPSAPRAAPAPTTPAPTPAPAPAAEPSDLGLSELQGKQVRLTLPGEDVQGLLWAYDADSGMVVLESRAAWLPEDLLAGTPYSAAYVTPAQRKADAAAPRRSFRLIRASDIRAAASLPSGPETTGPDAVAPSHFHSSVTAVAAGEARKAANVAQAKAKAPRIGCEVGWLGQSIFDALDKTLPVRWYEAHIIVLDQVVVHSPKYDTSSTRVPGYTPEQLHAALDGRAVPFGSPARGDQVVLPKNQSATSAKAIANSWNRVIKVLEGERARIFARRQGQAA